MENRHRSRATEDQIVHYFRDQDPPPVSYVARWCFCRGEHSAFEQPLRDKRLYIHFP